MYFIQACQGKDKDECGLDMLEIMTLLNNTVGQLPEDSEGTIQKQAPIAMTTLPEDSEGTIQKQAPIAMTTLRKKVIFEDNSHQMCDKEKVDTRLMLGVQA
nr:hypothetical protein BaRGS_011761 [Batillaria attramentaria]